MANSRHHAQRFSLFHRNTGFTLLEILVALAVLAIAVSAVVSAVNTHVSNAAHLRERTFAGWVGMNTYNELAVKGDWSKAGNLSGTTLLAQHEWAWTVSAKETDDPDVRRLDIKVFRKEGDETPLTTFVAYLGRPNIPLTPE